MVQVKQRKNPNHVELVKEIREFVGTLFIENKRKGIFVSTAKRFSMGSIDVAMPLSYKIVRTNSLLVKKM